MILLFDSKRWRAMQTLQAAADEHCCSMEFHCVHAAPISFCPRAVAKQQLVLTSQAYTKSRHWHGANRKQSRCCQISVRRRDSREYAGVLLLYRRTYRSINITYKGLALHAHCAGPAGQPQPALKLRRFYLSCTSWSSPKVTNAYNDLTPKASTVVLSYMSCHMHHSCTQDCHTQVGQSTSYASQTLYHCIANMLLSSRFCCMRLSACISRACHLWM